MSRYARLGGRACPRPALELGRQIPEYSYRADAVVDIGVAGRSGIVQNNGLISGKQLVEGVV